MRADKGRAVAPGGRSHGGSLTPGAVPCAAQDGGVVVQHAVVVVEDRVDQPAKGFGKGDLVRVVTY